MYVGVDVGGTKTLVAVLDDHAKILESRKFPTPQTYKHFVLELGNAAHHLKHHDFRAGGASAPGKLDRKHGRVLELGNLPWRDVPLQADCEKIFDCPFVVENDANLAGLSEAQLHRDKQTVLYVTVSTGIGTGVVYDGMLDPALLDSEGGHLMLPYKGKLTKWEHFASGRAIYEHFGKKAKDIHDADDWRYIVRNLALGFFELIAVCQPDLIVVGGSIGTYFDRYGELLQAELQKYRIPVVAIPPIVQAQRPEEAVIYGCYDLASQRYAKAA